MDKWFVDPLNDLRGNGDAGFIILLAALSLAERIIWQKKKADKLIGREKDFVTTGADFFGIPKTTFIPFWEMFRNGMMHHAHPFSGTFDEDDRAVFWDWDISKKFNALPELIVNSPNSKLIRIDPWKWLEVVVGKYDAYPNLIDQGDSRKLGTVRIAPETAQPFSTSSLASPPLPTPTPDLRTGSAR